jgi:hypothetical protein
MIEVSFWLLSPPETDFDHCRPPRPPSHTGARVTTDAGDVGGAGDSPEAECLRPGTCRTQPDMAHLTRVITKTILITDRNDAHRNNIG